jgi:acetyltransferase-like isoleucine patch superfamily enzyme
MSDSHFVAGTNCVVQPGSIVGFKYKEDCKPVKLGNNCCVRTGTILYGDVEANDDFQTGHNVLIRERTTFGDHIVIGTNTVIDGNVTMGDFVKIESNCYIPTHVTIGSRVFIGPGTVITNDKYPLKMRDQYKPMGPVIEDGVTIGGGVTIMPGVTIGRGSFIAGGCVVTKDIAPMQIVIGNPGVASDLPEKLKELNVALNWRKYLNE